ncbi:hypothetical protein Bbelb_029850 [Branchiostoma belcheri]|nr:hypothetical protein Bbelb_029850 [Branchiostoma belcheri]
MGRKLLGLHLDQNLTYDNHIAHIVKKCNRSLAQVGRVKDLLPHRQRIAVVNALIIPHIDYCCSVWGNTTQNNIRRLQVVQNRAARLALGCDRDAHVDTMLKTLGWLTTPVKQLSRREVTVSLDTIRALQDMARRLNDSVSITKTAAQQPGIQSYVIGAVGVFRQAVPSGGSNSFPRPVKQADPITEQADAMQRTTSELQVTLGNIYDKEVHAAAMANFDKSESLLGELSLITNRRLSRTPKKKGRRSASQSRKNPGTNSPRSPDF